MTCKTCGEDQTTNCGWNDCPQPAAGVVQGGAKLSVPTARALVLQTEGTKALVMIHPDGRVQFGKDYTPDEGAKVFWEALENLNPLRATLDLFRTLAVGCEDHRSYKGKREPRALCETCERMYEARQTLVGMGML